jgi:hypothetical protein
MDAPDPLAVGAMVAYCGWDPITPFSGTLEVDGTGTELLALPTLHLTGVSAVTVTDQWGNVTDRTIGAGNDVTWSRNGVLLWRTPEMCGVWPEGQQNVSVTCTSGYHVPPEDLFAALGSLSNRINGPTFGFSSARMGSGAVTFGQQIASGGLLVTEQMVFDRYRLPRVA